MTTRTEKENTLLALADELVVLAPKARHPNVAQMAYSLEKVKQTDELSKLTTPQLEACIARLTSHKKDLTDMATALEIATCDLLEHYALAVKLATQLGCPDCLEGSEQVPTLAQTADLQELMISQAAVRLMVEMLTDRMNGGQS